jgi:adenylate kinase
MLNVVLLGAPGAGKGTQAEILSKKYGIPVIGTGNIIRREVKSGSELGKQLTGIINSGQLVPDALVIEMLKNRLSENDCRAGYILDGFPRTVQQAEELERMGQKIDAVLAFEIDDDVILDRMAGRRICAKCGEPYHVKNKIPKRDGVCDLCGGELVTRKDDERETVRKRIAVYHEQTEPVKDFYRSRGLLRSIDAMQSIEAVTAGMLAALEAR